MPLSLSDEEMALLRSLAEPVARRASASNPSATSPRLLRGCRRASLRSASSEPGNCGYAINRRSNLARALMAGTASLVFMTLGAAGVRAETVIVQGADGANGANAVNSGENGGPGGDGESVAAAAGSVSPVTSPHNQSSVTGGNGGDGEQG
jgi:hypothetical protein